MQCTHARSRATRIELFLFAAASRRDAFFYSTGRVTFFLDSRLNGIFRARTISWTNLRGHRCRKRVSVDEQRARKRERSGRANRAIRRIKRCGITRSRPADLHRYNPSWPRSQWSHPAWQSQLIQSRHVPRDTREPHDDQRGASADLAITRGNAPRINPPRLIVLNALRRLRPSCQRRKCIQLN